MKTLHVLAMVCFLGNIITGLFWKAHGDRTADPRIISHTLQGIIRRDRWLTLPGVLLIIVFGVSAAVIGRLPLLGTDWIRYSVILFGASGLAFMLQVAPLQRRRWELWGVVAILTPLAALVLMVHKPAG